MNPRRTHWSTKVFSLSGGNEDNDLWTHPVEDTRGMPVIGSVWVPSEEERRKIAAGENVELLVWGAGHPPVALRVTDVPLGRAPRA